VDRNIFPTTLRLIQKAIEHLVAIKCDAKDKSQKEVFYLRGYCDLLIKLIPKLSEEQLVSTKNGFVNIMEKSKLML